MTSVKVGKLNAPARPVGMKWPGSGSGPLHWGYDTTSPQKRFIAQHFENRVFVWDCHKQIGTPTPFRCDLDLHPRILFYGAAPRNAYGLSAGEVQKLRDADSAALEKKVLRKSGLKDRTTLDQEMTAAFGKISKSIDLDAIAKSNGLLSSQRITVQVWYEAFVLYAPSKPAGSSMILILPSEVRIKSEITHICTEGECTEVEVSLLSGHDEVLEAPTKPAAELRGAWRRQDAEAKRREAEELLKEAEALEKEAKKISGS